MKRGHPLTKQAGETLAKDLRNRRFNYQRKRAARKPFESEGGGGQSIEFKIVSTRVATDTGDEAPYNGLTIATVTVMVTTPDQSDLIGTEVEVVDHSECIFDLSSGELVDVWGWASWRVAESLAPGAAPGTLTPEHWSADDRCC